MNDPNLPIDLDSLSHAIVVATIAHYGQVDKAGQPCILHPLRVMLSCNEPAEQMAAVLHDVVEDTAITLSDLAKYGFSQEVLFAVAALTRLKGESRIAAAHRAKINPIARVVKLADLADNMDMSRIKNPTSKDYKRLEEYRTVKQILEN